MNKPEILAPAGGEEQLIAAVRCGADAVYLGTQRFNARNSASNFNEDALINAVGYCHARNVKVYVAMNTLVTDGEMTDVTGEIKAIAHSGADAVIIQDMAVAALWKQHCPSMRLHASTQMTIHNLAGALAAKELGFKRIVLARELTFSEIEHIAKNAGVEIEIFVHGALCMSVSGTCLLSSMIGGRSGNRGRCAQPCRLNFQCKGREYALSLKDLSLIDELKKLAEIGVTSFKIEGRMKRPEYVAAAVTAVKNSLEGKAFDADALQAVFSRSGFTKGYLEGKRTLDMFGFRRKEDVISANPVLKNLASLYKDELKKVPVSIHLTAKKSGSELTVSDSVHTVSVSGDVPEMAKTRPVDNEYAEKCLSKTGGTIFVPERFSFDLDENIALSASQMNAMRRDALDRLYGLRATAQPKKFICDEKTNQIITAHYYEKTFRLRFEKYSQSFDDERIEKIILPMSEILKYPECAEVYSSKLICELPFLVFEEDAERFRRGLEKIKNMGVKNVLADNIGTFFEAKNMGFTVHGGHGLNILNSAAFGEYEKLGAADITLSPELMMSAAARITGNVKKGVLGYGFLPLMHFRACPAQTKKGCADCKGLSEITDRFGTPFYILCSAKKYSSLLNSVPLYIGDKPHDGVHFTTLYFTTEKKENCQKIFDAFYEKRPMNAKKTGGLYYRGLA